MHDFSEAPFWALSWTVSPSSVSNCQFQMWHLWHFASVSPGIIHVKLGQRGINSNRSLCNRHGGFPCPKRTDVPQTFDMHSDICLSACLWGQRGQRIIKGWGRYHLTCYPGTSKSFGEHSHIHNHVCSASHSWINVCVNIQPRHVK